MTEQPKSTYSAWVTVAFGTMGFLTGFVAGLSMTPIVGVILPLLFAAIGGGAGLFLGKKPEHSREVGISLTLLASMCLLGAIWGIHLRLGSPWKCFVTACGEQMSKTTSAWKLPDNEKDPKKLANLVSIRADLLKIKMDQSDREVVFQSAVKFSDSLDSTTEVLRKVTTSPGRFDTGIPALANQDPEEIKRIMNLLREPTAPAD